MCTPYFNSLRTLFRWRVILLVSIVNLSRNSCEIQDMSSVSQVYVAVIGEMLR